MKIAPRYDYLEQERADRGWLSRAARILRHAIQICARLLTRAIDERPNQTANESRHFAIARKNHSSWNFSPANQSTTITRYSG